MPRPPSRHISVPSKKHAKRAEHDSRTVTFVVTYRGQLATLARYLSQVGSTLLTITLDIGLLLRSLTDGLCRVVDAGKGECRTSAYLARTTSCYVYSLYISAYIPPLLPALHACKSPHSSRFRLAKSAILSKPEPLREHLACDDPVDPACIVYCLPESAGHLTLHADYVLDPILWPSLKEGCRRLKNLKSITILLPDCLFPL